MRHVVYYAYLGDSTTDVDVLSDRMEYIKTQLCWLATCVDKCSSNLSVTVAATCPDFFDQELISNVQSFGFHVYPVINRINTYEHHGFFCMFDIARGLSDSDYIFYCHSKGGVNRSSDAASIFKMHTYYLLADDALQLVKLPAHKVGLFPSQMGWLWHNFFWISSASLLSKKLEVSEYRHYYESFIGDSHSAGYLNCAAYRNGDFNTVGFQERLYYQPADLGAKSGLVAVYKHFSKFSSAKFVTGLEMTL